MALGSISVDRRFRGPPNSGNGGYVCGRLAFFLDGAAEVTLKSPPPLETPMSVVEGDDGAVTLRNNDQVVALARPVELEVTGFPHVSFDEARAAADRTMPPSEHKLPMCFVCGPDRADGDGLRIFPGALDPSDLDWTGTLAAPWVPGHDLAGDNGYVAPEFVWSALDCPTGYAVLTPRETVPILLGRLAVSIDRLPLPDERCVITSTQTASDGRKLVAEAAIFGDGGIRLAAAKATWLSVDRAVQLGQS